MLRRLAAGGGVTVLSDPSGATRPTLQEEPGDEAADALQHAQATIGVDPNTPGASSQHAVLFEVGSNLAGREWESFWIMHKRNVFLRGPTTSCYGPFVDLPFGSGFDVENVKGRSLELGIDRGGTHPPLVVDEEFDTGLPETGTLELRQNCFGTILGDQPTLEEGDQLAIVYSGALNPDSEDEYEADITINSQYFGGSDVASETVTIPIGETVTDWYNGGSLTIADEEPDTDDTDEEEPPSDDGEIAIISNPEVTVTFDQRDRDSRVYLSSFRLDDADRELLGDRSARIRSVAPDDEVLEHDRTTVTQPRSASNWDGYLLDRVFSFDERRVVRITQVVKLYPDDPFVIIETTLENTGSDRVVMNQPPANIHRGWRPAAFLELAEPVTTPQFHVSGSGTLAFTEVGRWRTFPLRDETPFVTLFDDEQGLVYGQLNGATAPELAITERDDENYLSYAVSGLRLAPGENAYYAAVLGGHSGGDGAVRAAEDLVNTAASRPGPF